MKESFFKAAFVAATAALAAYFEVLLFPIIIVAIVMLCDYASGVAAAWVHNELSSRTGIVGIVKKVAYALIVVVGIVIDWIVQTAADKVGIDAGNFYYFALLVIVWLIINECISILENVAKLGVPIPSFLVKLAEKLKATTEGKGEEGLR